MLITYYLPWIDGGVIDSSNSVVEAKPRKFLLDTTIEDATPVVRNIDTKDKEVAAKPSVATHFYEEVDHISAGIL